MVGDTETIVSPVTQDKRSIPLNTMLASGSSILYPKEAVVSWVLVLASNSTPTWIWTTTSTGSVATTQTHNTGSLVERVCVLCTAPYLFVGAVVVASMGTSLACIQSCNPVWPCRETPIIRLLERVCSFNPGIK